MTGPKLIDWIGSPKNYYIKVTGDADSQRSCVKKRGFFTGLDCLMHSHDYKLKKVYDYFQAEKGKIEAEGCISPTTSFQSVMQGKVHSHDKRSHKHNKWIKNLPSFMQKIFHKRTTILEYDFHATSTGVVVQAFKNYARCERTGIFVPKDIESEVTLTSNMDDLRECIRFLCVRIDLTGSNSPYSIETNGAIITVKKRGNEMIRIDGQECSIFGDDEDEQIATVKNFIKSIASEIIKNTV